jgi:DNA-binding NtrC family response regulator
VHGIMSSHHGAIAVDSAPGEGSTFHLYFPLVASELTTVATASVTPATAPVRGHGEHVLYVDDDETMVVVVERILKRAGYRVSSYWDPQEAVAAVRERPDAFDLVVTDFNMPEFSGLDVARAVMRIRPGLPVVISSGYITEEMRDEARLAGVRCMLEKQNLFEDIRGLLGRILLQDAGQEGQ